MKKKAILSLALAGALLLGACTPAQQQATPPAGGTQTETTTPEQGGTTTTTETQQPANLDRGLTMAGIAEPPSIAIARHTTLVGHFMNVMQSNGLFRTYYGTSTPVPDLVREWRAVTDTIFEFDLHEGVLFHNGEELTADDVVASMYYVRTTPDQRAVHLSAVGWEAVDRYTVRFDTGEPQALFFFDLAHHGNHIMPRALIEEGNDFDLNPVGTGPFVFDEWRRGDSLRWTRFDEYFDVDRAPTLAYIHWRIIPEGTSRAIALEAGEVDYLLDVPFPDIPRLEAEPHLTVQSVASTTFQYLTLNNDRFPFNNIHVRHAIDMALDREAMLIASLDGYGVAISGTIPPMMPGASPHNLREFDPQGARDLLAEHNLDPATLGFEMIVFDEMQRRRAEVAQANLMDIGIQTTISQVDFATWGDLTIGDTFDASFANWTSLNLLAFMRSLLTIEFIDINNRSRFRNEEVSDIIETAMVTVDEAQRLAMLYDASTITNYYSPHLATNMGLIIRAFNANLHAPELGGNGFMHMNMMRWMD
ncbi:MAG: ABC transporter substrate-binding protein [Defluviitaleaceae bacterium]|nr:ABC transporter substrate-binding protein [Defluviitaleaceae bacterium]